MNKKTHSLNYILTCKALYELQRDMGYYGIFGLKNIPLPKAIFQSLPKFDLDNMTVQTLTPSELCQQ